MGLLLDLFTVRRTQRPWSVVQEKNTPDDITLPHPLLDDQPHSGVLYLDSVVYAKSDR